MDPIANALAIITVTCLGLYAVLYAFSYVTTGKSPEALEKDKAARKAAELEALSPEARELRLLREEVAKAANKKSYFERVAHTWALSMILVLAIMGALAVYAVNLPTPTP